MPLPIVGILAGIGQLWTAWLDSKKAKYEAEKNFQLSLAEAEATWDLVALRQAQFSWKDELITLIVFGPLMLAWIPEYRSGIMEWVEFVSALPVWYQMLIFGITAASFGLRWFFKQQNFKVGGNHGSNSS